MQGTVENIRITTGYTISELALGLVGVMLTGETADGGTPEARIAEETLGKLGYFDSTCKFCGGEKRPDTLDCDTCRLRHLMW